MTSRIGTKAFLLVEAVVTGVVMATGVAMVSRSLTMPLHAMKRLQERETLLRLADSTLAVLEHHAMTDSPLASRRGRLEPPHERAEWILRVTSESDAANQTLPEDSRLVTLTVRDVARPATAVTLTSLWPREWVEE